LAQCIRRPAKEVLGVSRGGGGRRSGMWWWSDEVREKVKEKQKAYTILEQLHSRGGRRSEGSFV